MPTEDAHASSDVHQLDAVARIDALAARLSWESTDNWLPRQPDWLQRFVVARDPADNGANLLLMAEGLKASVLAGDRAGEVLAQLTLLRSLEVPTDSVAFERLGDEVAAIGDRYLEALYRVQLARAHIFHRSEPGEILADLDAAVQAAAVARDLYIDTVVSDWVGSYAVMVGSPDAATRAFEFLGSRGAVGTQPWILGRLNLASVAISDGDLSTARERLGEASPFLESAAHATRNFAEWIDILSAERIEVVDRARLSERDSLVVRKRAIRRFYFADLFGVIPVEQCVEEVLAGLPVDSATGLVTVSALRSFLDESVAVGDTVQLASVGLPGLLNAAGQLPAVEASALVEAVGQRFAAAQDSRLVLAQLDLDRYVVFSDAEPIEFNALLQELLQRLQQPIVVGAEPLLLRPLARTTVSEFGDTGYSVWERVFSIPRGDTPGNPITIAAPESVQSEQRYRLVQELLSDSLEQYAQVEFQPIVDVEAEAVAGFEALLRWDSPSLGKLPPPVVVEAAERCGAVGALERHIASTAIEGAAALRQVAVDCRVNVNLTARQLADEAMARHLISECERVSVDASAIGIELTESALIDHASAEASLDLLAEHGFAIALDDFGTGYSNLAYLVEMRNVGLKIDGSFVRRMLEDERADTVCRMLINTADTLGAPIVAEQVETDAHVAALRELGCVLHQGYRFSPARPIGQAVELVQDPGTYWTWPS